jgi:hypothetical protein
MNNQNIGAQLLQQSKFKPRYGREITNQEWFAANEIQDSVLWIMPESRLIKKGRTMLEGELGKNWDYNKALKNYPTLFKMGEFHDTMQKVNNNEITASSVSIADYASQEYYSQTQEFFAALMQRGYKENPTIATKRLISDYDNGNNERLSAVFSRHDFPALLAQVPIISLMLPTRRQHFLTGLFQNLTTDNLEFQVGEFAPIDGVRENIGEFEVPTEIGLGAYTFTPISMVRAGWHMAVSEEIAFNDYTQPIEAQHLDSLRGAMDEVLDRHVGDELASVSITDTALGSWSASTAGISDRKAQNDLDLVLAQIDEDKAAAAHLVSQRRARLNYEANTYVHGAGIAVALPNQNLDRRNNVAGSVTFFPGLDWTADNLYPNATSFIATAEEAGIVARGPTRTSSYLDVLRSIRGTVHKQFFAVDVFRFDLIERGTLVAP